MKNLYKNKKLTCTIISDTPYAKNKNGELVGLGPCRGDRPTIFIILSNLSFCTFRKKGNLHYHLINIIKIILPLYQ